MAHITPNGKIRPLCVSVQIILSLAALSGFFSVPAFSQGTSCSPNPGFLFLHEEGLTEQVADITMSCVGGTAGSGVQLGLFITLNTNITNRIDTNNNILGVTVSIDSGGGPAPTGLVPALSSPSTIALSQVQYTVPNPSSQQVKIIVSGIRAAVTAVAGGGLSVTAGIFASGVQMSSVQPVVVGIGQASLLDAVALNGPICGSPQPATLDFPGLSSAGTVSSTVRVTEGFASSFFAKSATTDTGVRIIMKLTSYPNTEVLAPVAVVGSTGSAPTSVGTLGASPNSGSYLPGAKQLLLVLVTGADATGYGGSWALAAAPTIGTQFSSVAQIPMTSGVGYAVYEVLDSNPNIQEWAEIPIFLVAPVGNCQAFGVSTMVPELGPVSTVAVATQGDPIPRFVANTPGPDCQVLGDCSAILPLLSVSQTAITLNGSSFGLPQTITDQVSNNSGGQMSFSTSITYQNGGVNSTGTNWLSVSPTSGINSTLLTFTADPTSLAQGTYSAAVTINAGSAGTSTVTITFNVGAVAPVLKVTPKAITFTGYVSGPGSSTPVNVVNAFPATGKMTFSVTTAYQFGYASLADIYWLSITPTSGTDNTTLTLTVATDRLIAGVYQATVTINAGSAGTIVVPVTFTVTAGPTPTIQGVVSAASFQPPPIGTGSFAAIFGLNLAPKTTAPVTVTFAGSPATVVYDSATQINVLVPAALGSAASAGVIATVDGIASSTFTVNLAANAPAVFNPGILNQDNSENSASGPASRGDTVQIFLTGLTTAVSVPVTVNIGSQSITGGPNFYVGAVASIPGLEQVNVQVPAGLTFTGNSAPLTICVPGTGTQPVCSGAVNLYLK